LPEQGGGQAAAFGGQAGKAPSRANWVSGSAAQRFAERGAYGCRQVGRGEVLGGRRSG
jgi:hypothetical protein